MLSGFDYELVFSPRNIVGLGNTVYLICYFQVAVELVLLSLLCFLLCVLFCTFKVSLGLLASGIAKGRL